MTDNKQIAITDDRLQEALLIFEDHTEGKTIKELAEKYNLSERTISKRLNDAREYVYDELTSLGKRLAATVWKKYEKLETKAWKELERTGDPKWASVIQAILRDMRQMFTLDKPPQAPVNQAGETVPMTIIFNINDTKYKELEAKQDQIIDGEVTEAKE